MLGLKLSGNILEASHQAGVGILKNSIHAKNKGGFDSGSMSIMFGMSANFYLIYNLALRKKRVRYWSLFKMTLLVITFLSYFFQKNNSESA